MSYSIIIRGPLGCGKTTIAKKLAEKINAHYFSIDQILQEHGLDKVDDPDAETIPAKNFIKANEIILPIALRELEQGRVVIFPIV